MVMAADPAIALGDLVDDYLLDCHRRGLRPATIRYYRTAIDCFARTTGVDDLSDFDRPKVRTFQDESPTLSPVSMRGYLQALRTFSTWLADEGLTSADRLAGLRLPRVDQTLKLVPTDAELVALIASAAVQLRVLITLLAGTGLRISDAVGLDAGDLRGDDLLIRTTKNRRSRLVHLDRTLADVLAIYVADSRPPVEMGGGSPLFVNRLRQRATPGGARQALADARTRAGLPFPVGPHVLRHWFARDLASHATSDRLLAARMGWISSTLQTRYAPVSEEELRGDVARYAPIARLQSAGLLDGLLPIGRSRRGPGSATSRSNSVSGKTATGLPGAARQS